MRTVVGHIIRRNTANICRRIIRRNGTPNCHVGSIPFRGMRRQIPFRRIVRAHFVQQNGDTFFP